MRKILFNLISLSAEMLEKKEKIERVKNLVQSLEGTKRDTLRVIMQHLRK